MKYLFCVGKKSTPGRGSKTPSGGDRFIPNRSTTQFDLGHHLLTGPLVREDEELLSPSQREFRKAMNDNLNGERLESKIISYKAKAPNAPEGLIHCYVYLNGFHQQLACTLILLVFFNIQCFMLLGRG